MKRSGKCPKCGSGDVIADAKATKSGTHRGEMLVETLGKPTAIFFTDKHESIVSAWICAQCGFVELYADAPQDLKVETV